MLKSRFENPGLLLLGSLFFAPFVLYGFGVAGIPHLIAALILLTYAVMLVLNFEIGFLTLIFIRSSLDYMKNFGAEGSAVNLAAIISVGLIVLGIFYVLYRRCNILQFEDSKPFLVFLAITGCSVMISPDRMVSLSFWLRLVSVFSVYVLTRLIFVSESKIKMAMTAILMSALVPVILGYYQLISGNGTIYDSGQYRIVGTFLHPNAFASYLLILLLFSTPQLLEGNHIIDRHFFGIFMFLTSVIFIFTLSRGAWIVFIVGMLLMGIMRYRKLLGLLPPLLLIAIFTVPAVRERISDVFEPNTGHSSSRSAWEWRLETWEEISSIVKEKPLLGHGLAAVEMEYEILTHNDYLGLLAETGAVGLLAYLILAFSALGRSWSDYKQSRSPLVRSFQVGLICMMAAFLVREFADNTLRNTVVLIYFWVLVALVRNLTLLHAQRLESGQLKPKIEYDEAA